MSHVIANPTVYAQPANSTVACGACRRGWRCSCRGIGMGPKDIPRGAELVPQLVCDASHRAACAGLPPGLAMQLQGPESLRSDACVATAEAFLDNLVASNTKAHPNNGLLARCAPELRPGICS